MGKQNYTPFLDQAQVAQLAKDLHIPPAAVRVVCQACGHELRERYRRRGWMPSKEKDENFHPNNQGKSQRQATAIAYKKVRRANAS